MLFLSVGLHIHPTEACFLDEDACSDFVNRLGKKLKQLRSLDIEQISEVLRRAQIGGHIRWHKLETEQIVISSTFRDVCKDTYRVSVGLQGPGLGVTPGVLDETQLCELVEALGDDLDEVRKLMDFQVAEVLEALCKVGKVKCFEMQPLKPIEGNPSVPSGNYSTDPIPLPTSDPTLSSPVQSSPQARMDFDLFINYNDSMEESVLLPPVDTIDAGACPPFPAATPAESVGTLPDLDGGASCYSMPSTHYIYSPPASESLYLPGPVNYLQETGVKHDPRMNHSYSFGNHLDREEAFPLGRSVSPPLMPNGIGADSTVAVVMSPESVNISPGLNGGASHHSTPTYANSLPAEELLTPPSSDVINRQSSISSQEEIILELLLKSCKFNDKSKKSVKKQAQEVLDAERFLLTQDPCGVLLAFLDPDQWEINMSRDLHGLGLPRE